uniref:M42 family peptidase n=1 Tax=Caldisericum exile TaxID=693075 RepID=A0A7C4TY53_9BACT
MKEVLEKLVRAFGVSSKEERVRSVIREELSNYDFEISEDKFGNLIVHVPHDGPKLMLASHLDSVGVMVTDIDKNGLVRFAPVGDIKAHFLLGTQILFENGVEGMVYCDDKELQDIKNEHLFIDIGARSKKEALSLVQIGSGGIFSPHMYFSKDRVISPSLDDRIGCGILVEVLKNVKKKNLRFDLYAVFTVEEEVGVKGARTSTYEITPDIGIVVDVTPALDFVEPKRNAIELGKGPAIKVMDGRMITNMEVRETLVNVARKNEIPFQLEVVTTGTTDAFAMQITKEGVRTGAISIPARYIHTQGEVVDLNDVKNAISLLINYIEK